MVEYAADGTSIWQGRRSVSRKCAKSKAIMQACILIFHPESAFQTLHADYSLEHAWSLPDNLGPKKLSMQRCRTLYIKEG